MITTDGSSNIADYLELLTRRELSNGDARALVGKLAQRLCDVRGRDTANAILESLAHEGEPTQPLNDDTLAPTHEHGGAIGAWQARLVDGHTTFVRDVADHVWRSDSKCFEPKGSRRRVVFLGESAARGYLYANEWTPAKTLEGLLSQCGIAAGVEVLDLSLVSIGLDELVVQLNACRQLEPDCIVVFAGNNWFKKLRKLPGSSRCEMGNALRVEGIAGLRRRLETTLRDTIERQVLPVLRCLNESAPVVFVLPEFNLADWQHVDPRDVVWLDGDKLEAWHRLRREAEELLARGELEQACSAFSDMTVLDEGTAATGLVGQAECARRAGDIEVARELLSRARDCRLLDTRTVPSSYGVIESTMRCAAANGDFTLIDLPCVFKRYLAGALPDRRLFLDFCHLSSEGIRVASVATALELSPLLGGETHRFEQLMLAAQAPSPRVESRAHFLAAILNAHRGQRYEIVRYHCGRALEADLSSASVLGAYLGVLSGTTPLWLSAAIDNIEDTFGAQAASAYMTDHWVIGRDCLDATLFDAIADSLSAVTGFSRAESWRARIEAFGVCDVTPVELASTFFADSLAGPARIWTSLREQPVRSPLQNRTGHRQDTFEVYAETTDFQWLCNATQAVSFALTCRLVPRAVDKTSSGRGYVLVNDEEIADFVVDTQWRRHVFLAQPRMLRAGANTLSIRFPLDIFSCGRRQLNLLADEIQRECDESLPAHLVYPPFAEIHSLRAHAAGRVSECSELECQPAQHAFSAAVTPSAVGPGDNLLPVRGSSPAQRQPTTTVLPHV